MLSEKLTTDDDDGRRRMTDESALENQAVFEKLIF